MTKRSPTKQLEKPVRTDHQPDYSLKRNIEFPARQLAGESGGRTLREFLFKKFHEAMPDRRSFSIIELIFHPSTLS